MHCSCESWRWDCPDCYAAGRQYLEADVYRPPRTRARIGDGWALHPSAHTEPSRWHKGHPARYDFPHYCPAKRYTRTAIDPVALIRYTVGVQHGADLGTDVGGLFVGLDLLDICDTCRVVATRWLLGFRTIRADFESQAGLPEYTVQVWQRSPCWTPPVHNSDAPLLRQMEMFA